MVLPAHQWHEVVPRDSQPRVKPGVHLTEISWHPIIKETNNAEVSWQTVAREGAEMTHVYFHCSNTKKVFVDRRGAMVEDIADARDHANRIVQSLTRERSLEDWRDWILHVSDDQGDELFVVPFAFVLGEPN